MTTEKKQLTPLQSTLIACRIMAIYSLIFGCILNMLMLAAPIYSMQVLDRVLSSGNTDTLLALSMIVTLALALTGMVQGARAYAVNRMGMWFEKQLSSLLFTNSVKMAAQSRSNAGSQQLRDLQTIKTFLIGPAVTAILDVPWSIIFLIVLFFLHGYMGCLALFGGMLLIGIGILADRVTSKTLERNNENFLMSMRQVEESTRNAEVTEVMAMLPNVIKSWQKLNNIVQSMQSLTNERQIIFTELMKLIRSLLQIAVTGLGAYLTIRGEFSSGALIASSTLLAKALAPFEVAINAWKGYVKCRQSYERINQCCTSYSDESDLMSLPDPEGNLALENVYLTPPGTNIHTLLNISFSLQKGETLVVIGESGSGKTSLAKVMVGIWLPVSGSVRLDGVSFSDLKKSEVGAHIGYLPQSVELFSGSVMQNIARMAENPDSEKVVKAAKLAGAHEMIINLPKGYNTEIGLEGSALSGGQRQRIGLARAFYNDPKLIVLDEPNASLDAHGDQALMKAVQYAKSQGITVIMISHRNTVLSLADKIAIIHHGSLAAFGDRDEIIKKNYEESSTTSSAIEAS